MPVFARGVVVLMCTPYSASSVFVGQPQCTQAERIPASGRVSSHPEESDAFDCHVNMGDALSCKTSSFATVAEEARSSLYCSVCALDEAQLEIPTS